MHHETLRALRDEMAPLWRPVSSDNVEKTVSPDKLVAIVVWSGNRDTGLAHRHPSSKRPRGGATLKEVDDNLQCGLFPNDDRGEAGGETSATWVLLYYVDERKEEIRVELSMPLRYDHDGVVRRWGPRLILNAIPLSDQVVVTQQNGNEEEYDVPVKRREA
jgi:hypothetical protein